MRAHRLLLVISGVLLLGFLPFLLEGGVEAKETRSQVLAKPGPEASGGQGSGPGPETDGGPDGKKQDDAVRLLVAIGAEDFKAPEDVATGRFLEELEAKIQLVKSLDTQKLHALAQGPGWARLTAPYRPLKHWFEQEEEEKVLVLDLVIEEEHWKLENLRVASRRRP